MSDADLPPEAWALAMAGLSGVGPSTLRALLAAGEGPRVWAQLLAGEPPVPPRAAASGAAPLPVTWATEAARTDVGAVWSAHRDAGVSVAMLGGEGYPELLAEDPDPPGIVCWRGRLAALGRPRVAVVGTRRCSRRAFDLARQLGRGLASAGVAVVSGLALGVDGAAHAGALQASEASPVGVVASGLDVVYPAKHRDLWDRVAQRGLLLSEAPLGARPSRWRFPARNRLIAALAALVVVVETPAKGGSLYTVDEAQARDVPVLVVPGPVGPRCTEGSNQLLVDGAEPVRDTTDVLLRLGFEARAPAPDRRDRPEPDGDAGRALAALGFVARSFAELVDDLGWPPGRVAAALGRLEADGLVARRGPWLERLGPR